MKFRVGQPVRRRENPRGLRAKRRYIDDIPLPRLAHTPRGCEAAAQEWITAPDISAEQGLRETVAG